LFAATSLDSVKEIVDSAPALAALAELETLFSLLAAHGVAEWVRFDPTVVRGLAYYTGVVYEVFDAGRSLRAIAGGGRYDDLLQKLGGERLPAVGFGMGDVVIAELLREKGLLPSGIPGPDLWLVSLDGDGRKLAALAARLRASGREVGFSFGGAKLGKQMQAAQENGAKRAVFVGSDRVGAHEVEVKDLATGEQKTVSVEALCT
jgi:histidyl-tRNA synthetase